MKLILIALAFVVLAFIAARYFGAGETKRSPDGIALFPCPMDRTPGGLKQIRIKDIDPALLDKTLEEFCTHYELDRKPEVQQDGTDWYVTADSSLPYMTFAYLVNALRYCDKSRTYDVTGWYSMQANEQDGKGLELSHTTLMMYIPDEDDEFDNVFFVTEDGRFFKQTFASRCPLEQLSRDHRPYETA